MEAPPGFEPGHRSFADSCLTTWLWRRIDLEENEIKKDLQRGKSADGADDEARTRYLHLGKVALYQMSYIRKSRKAS